jgi:catechol 2,3-dioxygenase-like lactoylglutathione lyase family enzyme
MSHFIGIHHAGIVVPDIERAINFYCRGLDMELVHEGGWQAPSPIVDAIVGVGGTTAKVALLRSEWGFIELFQYLAPDQPEQVSEHAYRLGIRHVCFEVTDPDEALQQIVQAGGEKMFSPQQIPGGGKAIYCRDPFGNLIELTTATGRMPSIARQEVYPKKE